MKGEIVEVANDDAELESIIEGTDDEEMETDEERPDQEPLTESNIARKKKAKKALLKPLLDAINNTGKGDE